MFYSRPNSNKYQEKPSHHKCYKCGEDKPFNTDFYHSHVGRKFGLNYICIVCDNKRKSGYTKANRQKANETRRLYELNNKSIGKCQRCASSRLPNSNNFCERHYLSDLAYKSLGSKSNWEFIKKLLESQNYKCAYTGIPLVLGVNASIDHIKSIKHNPNLKHDPNNICWADIEINRMKREHSEERFIELCSLVVTHHGDVSKMDKGSGL